MGCFAALQGSGITGAALEPAAAHWDVAGCGRTAALARKRFSVIPICIEAVSDKA